MVRAEAARLTGLPARAAAPLAADPDPTVRASTCENAWASLGGTVRRKLITDSDDEVRRAALRRHHRDHALSRTVFEAEELGERALSSCRLESGFAERLARHGSPAQRQFLAQNPFLDRNVLLALAEDPDDTVRFEVSVRPELTEEERAGVRVHIDPDCRFPALAWVTALHSDPEALRRLASSSHLLVRRSVARARRLPPDVVALLARDEDRVVRLFLAESCDDAPPGLLLEVWRWWDGSLSCPGRPRNHPNFPRHGLLRHADDPDPRMRQLALDDPESTHALVERFSRDVDADVRLRAATDHRLPAAAAVWLLDDPDERLRQAAARHPRLPARILVDLLRTVDAAEDAALNPALPAGVMRRMVTRIPS
ncbi:MULTISPECIES: hypothetical protein [Streptomyces]|uniref:hypothetical protein n=1 Tax=Streptomyces TaxID=1883 RepID=UPI00067CB99E|nr:MULTISPECIES: hypothetical protein [Streptomyces]